jgi:hypothetical protein
LHEIREALSALVGAAGDDWLPRRLEGGATYALVEAWSARSRDLIAQKIPGRMTALHQR